MRGFVAQCSVDWFAWSGTGCERRAKTGVNVHVFPTSRYFGSLPFAFDAKTLDNDNRELHYKIEHTDLKTAIPSFIMLASLYWQAGHRRGRLLYSSFNTPSLAVFSIIDLHYSVGIPPVFPNIPKPASFRRNGSNQSWRSTEKCLDRFSKQEAHEAILDDRYQDQ
jgi:hypothetical protein